MPLLPVGSSASESCSVIPLNGEEQRLAAPAEAEPDPIPAEAEPDPIPAEAEPDPIPAEAEPEPMRDSR